MSKFKRHLSFLLSVVMIASLLFSVNAFATDDKDVETRMADVKYVNVDGGAVVRSVRTVVYTDILDVTYADKAKPDGYMLVDVPAAGYPIPEGKTPVVEVLVVAADHEHVYPDNWEKLDDIYHVKVCGLCKAQTLEPHVDVNNDGKCDECEAPVAIHEHKFTSDWEYLDEVNHVKVCGECKAEVTEAHSDRNEDGVCDVCKGPVGHEHNFANDWEYLDEVYHVKTCADCGASIYELHADANEDGKCDECKAPVAVHEHNFVNDWEYLDEVYHVKTCADCGASIYELHADANEDGKCDACDAPVGHEHNFANDWEYLDEVYHVKTCADCGAAIYELHADANEDGKCDVCDAPVGHEHNFANDWEYLDGVYHVKTCADCGAAIYELHYDANEDGKCDACDAPVGHEHNFANDWEYLDEVYHVKTCADCGGSIYELHYDANEDGKCDACDAPVGHEHNFANDWEYLDEVYHVKTCADCGASIYELHADANEDGKCDACDAPVGHEHNFANDWEYLDEVYHVKTCADCGAAIYELHADANEDGKCDACDGPVGHEHNFANDWEYLDGVYHVKTCADCGAAIYELHYDANEDGKCDACDGPVGHEHNFANDWEYLDEVYHVKTCADCGGSIYELHYDANEDGKCDACKAPVGHEHNFANDWEYLDEVYHVKTCADCGAAIYDLHTDANNDGKCDACGADVSKETETRVLHINYITESGRIISREPIVILKDASQVSAADFKRIPEGYKVANTNPYNILNTTKELDVLVSKIEEPAPETRVLRINYITESGRIVSREPIVILKDASQVSAADFKRIPEGYKVVNTNPYNILNTTKELDVLVSKIADPAPETRSLRVNYVTESGRIISRESITIRKDANQVFATDFNRVPEGYKVVNTNPYNILNTTKELNVLVAEIEPEASTKTIFVNYVTENGTPVLTSNMIIAADATCVNTGLLEDVPYGYEIAILGDIAVNGNAINVVVREKECTRTVTVNYVTEDGKNVLTSSIVVDKNATAVNTSELKDAIYGYEIAIVGDVAIENNAIEVVVRETKMPEPETRGLRINYVTESGRIISRERITILKDANQVFATDFKHVPEGYKVVNTNPYNILNTTKELDVLVAEIEPEASTKTIFVNYVTENGAPVLTSNLIIAADATCVNTGLLEDVPYGYEIAIVGDVAIENNAINVVVREKAYTRTVIVNYVTEDGQNVLTSSIVVDENATAINTSILKDAIYGYEIAIVGDIAIENNAINVVVRAMAPVDPTVPETTVPETTVPETTVPETTVPETTVPETTESETTVPETTEVETTEVKATESKTTEPADKAPHTGDESHMGLWVALATVSLFGAVAAFFFDKRRNTAK